MWLNLIKKDSELQELIKLLSFPLIAERMIDLLKLSINMPNWRPNTPKWIDFKQKHGLALNPLIASQFMKDTINWREIENA